MSQSQVGQDLWVLEKLNNKRGGYFIELGGGDGKFLSNTYMLENDYGWSGVAIEPTRKFEELCKNRKCFAVQEYVAGTARTETFLEGSGDDMDAWANASHVYSSGFSDIFSRPVRVNGAVMNRVKPKGNETEVQTRTLSSILDEIEAPSIIDYLSLDVEGAELEILTTFPFDRYKFRTMTIEINGAQPEGDDIRKLLESKGYTFDCSLKELDDCYVMEMEMEI